jgi:hypothetical protein
MAAAEQCPPKFAAVADVCVIPFADTTRRGSWEEASEFCSAAVYPGYESMLAEFWDLENPHTVAFIKDMFGGQAEESYDNSFPVWIGARLVPQEALFKTLNSHVTVPVAFNPRAPQFECVSINKVADNLVLQTLDCGTSLMFACSLKQIRTPCADSLEASVCADNSQLFCETTGLLATFCAETCGVCSSLLECAGENDMWDASQCMKLAHKDFCEEEDFRNRCPRSCCQRNHDQLSRVGGVERLHSVLRDNCESARDDKTSCNTDNAVLAQNCTDDDFSSGCLATCCKYLKGVMDEVLEDKFQVRKVSFEEKGRLALCANVNDDARPSYCKDGDACTKYWGFCKKTC